MPEGDMFTERQLALQEGWERSETSAGIPYYLNHADGTTHWDHQDMVQVFKDLDGLNSIKREYGAYRAAMKLRIIQKVTQLDMVDISKLEQAFTELGMSHTHSNGVLTVIEVESVLKKIFQLAEQAREGLLDTEKCTELSLNWILKCYDSGRTGAVKLRSLKICAAALCSATLERKYRFIFKQVSGGHVGISYSSLRILLKDLLLLTQGVSESALFSPDHSTDAVESCWNAVGNQPSDIINVEKFLQWMLREPVSLVWLPTLHRLASAETVRHEAKCAICKSFPIVGFRYRCLKCTNVDLCQSCYWTQQPLKDHKPTHPTREYCLATTTGDDVRDFAKQMKNKLTRKYRHKPLKKSYLDHPLTERRDDEDLQVQSPVFTSVHVRIGQLATRLRELDVGNGSRSFDDVDGRTDDQGHHDQDTLVATVRGLQAEKRRLQDEVRMLKGDLAAQAKKSAPMKVVQVAPEQKSSPGQESHVQNVASPAAPRALPFTPHPSHEWSYILGAEEQELETMVSELTAAFPPPDSHFAVAGELGNELFIAAQEVGTALGSVVKEIADTQELPQ